jgi:hypothetical protein
MSILRSKKYKLKLTEDKRTQKHKYEIIIIIVCERHSERENAMRCCMWMKWNVMKWINKTNKTAAAD